MMINSRKIRRVGHVTQISQIINSHKPLFEKLERKMPLRRNMLTVLKRIFCKNIAGWWCDGNLLHASQ